MRLDKFLAEAAVGKKKVVRAYIMEGKVMVNKKIIVEPSFKIDEYKDNIEYNDEKVEHLGKLYYMFNKPAGCITAKSDRENKTVFEYFKGHKYHSLFHIGRLDKDTEGLLLFTNDGDFEHRLMHPTKHIEKTYFLWALGTLNEEQIKELENGINIGQDEEIITKPSKVKLCKSGEYSKLIDEIPRGEIKKINNNKFTQPVISLELTISEGKKHQVKRMMKAMGCYVIYLKRIAIGNLGLDENLSMGEFRELSEKEVNMALGKI